MNRVDDPVIRRILGDAAGDGQAEFQSKRLWKGANTQLDKYRLGHILTNVDLTDEGCWVWNGHTDPKGYPEYRESSGGKIVFCQGVHRMLYEYKTGETLGDLYACHRCDNPPCCNPDHIFAGTAKDNYEDAVSKGRHRWVRRPTRTG